MRIFKSPIVIDGNAEQEEFQTRQSYIINMDHNFAAVLEAFTSLLSTREAMGKSLQQFGYSLKDNFGINILKEKDEKGKSKTERNSLFSYTELIYELVCNLKTGHIKQVNIIQNK